MHKQDGAGMSEENTNQNRQDKTTDDLVIAKRQWERVRSRLRAELGEATFNSWFRHLEILKTTLCLYQNHIHASLYLPI